MNNFCFAVISVYGKDLVDFLDKFVHSKHFIEVKVSFGLSTTAEGWE